MGAVEVVFRYVVVNPKCTSFSVSRVEQVTEWSPKDKPEKLYLFPQKTMLRPSIRTSGDDFSTETYVLSQGNLITVDYSTGTHKHTRHREYALLLVRNGSQSQLDGIDVTNADKIYSMHDEQLTIIAHKGLVDQGYLISSTKPYSNAIAFYAKQILTKTINIPHIPEQKTDEISGRLKTLIDSL